MGKPYPSLRIFKSDFCEFFTHVHPVTPLLIWVPVIVYFFYRAFALGLSAGMIGTLAVLGLFVWTLFEYALHRFVFHYPAQSTLGQRFVFITHGLHHEDSQDPTRLVMPPFAGICIAIVLFSVFRTIFGPVYVEPFFGAFLVGYLCYDYVHYAVHHFTPRTRIGKLLKQNHMTHHYIRPNSRWGVSSPLWDYVFGTFEATEQVRHGS